MAQAKRTTYWFDYQDVRVVVIDGTSALDLGTAKAQARRKAAIRELLRIGSSGQASRGRRGEALCY